MEDLKRLREAAGLGQTEAARLVGCSRWTIIKYESGPAGPRQMRAVVERMRSVYAEHAAKKAAQAERLAREAAEAKKAAAS